MTPGHEPKATTVMSAVQTTAPTHSYTYTNLISLVHITMWGYGNLSIKTDYNGIP